MKKLVLIDGNALVHRAFHSMPPTLASPKGVITNAVFGFTSILFRMFQDIKPDYIAATFDLAGKTFRHHEFEDYKSHRVKAPDELYAQIPIIKEIVRALGIPVYEKEGFEADDVIGHMAEVARKEKNLQVVIVTGDLDTLQLVEDDKVVVFTPKKGISDTMIYNEKEVIKRYGLRPYQITDYKGLKGDPSDNIPGVPGVGDKTASELLKKYETVENLYVELEKMAAKQSAKPTGKEKKKTAAKTKKSAISEKLLAKLLEFKDQAFFSKKLATIIRDVPVDFSMEATDWKKHLKKDEVDRLLREYGFFSLLKRTHEVYGKPEDSQYSLELSGTGDNQSAEHLDSADKIRGALAKAAKADVIAFDLQDGVFSFSLDGKSVQHCNIEDVAKNEDDADILRTLSDILGNEKVSKIGHDIKPQMKKLLAMGLDFSGANFDIQIAAYLLNPDFKDYDLERIYFNEFMKDMDVNPQVRPLTIWELKEKLEKKIKANELDKVFYEIEMPLMRVLADMEMTGIKVDAKSLSDLSTMVNKELAGLEKAIYKMAGAQFNINSPAQLSEILYDRLAIKGKIKRTGTGARSTAVSELEKIVDEHPIVAEIMKYREYQKIKTTYIEPFPELLDKEHRVHTTYLQTGAATGRLASVDPNLQNIPIKTELGQEFRKSFIASPGYKLLSLDYSQLELRIVAHISGDKKMTAAFKRGEDIHTRTAAEIFNVEPAAVTPNMRRQAKVLNFGLIYGMGILGFQRASGVDREKARMFIDRYMEEFSGVAKYMSDMKTKARKDGYVSTIFGRKRFLPDINSGIPMMVAQAERIAINMPIQGTNADLIKMAMIKIQDLINSKYSKGEVKMLLQVHDELVFEVKNDVVQSAAKEIKKLMEDTNVLDVPLVTEPKYGDNWRDMALI